MFSQTDLSKGISMRPIRPGDGEWERILHDAGRPELSFIEGEQDFIQSIYDFQFKARNEGYGSAFPNAMYFMVEKNGDAIGRVVMDFDQGDAHIVDLAVHPLYQNKGYGQVILQALKNVAAASGAPLSLSARRDNPGAINLYTRLGFQPVQTVQEDPVRVFLEWIPEQSQSRQFFI